MTLLAERFPEIADDLDESIAGNLHLGLFVLARKSLTAIRMEDVTTLKSHFTFVEDAFRNGTPEVQDALCVAYLEQIDFRGRRARKLRARELLSPPLETAVKSLEEFWDRERSQG